MFLHRSLVAIIFFLAAALPLAAQRRPLCDVTCGPDPSSPTYGGTYKARPQSKNVRGTTTVLAPRSADAASGAPTLPGSESYGYAIPIVGLPGRNGLDVNLTLYYNSAIWTIDLVNGTATFNADRDFPSYGFHLGYGMIEAPPSGDTSYLLTEPDGTKRELRLSSGTTYITADSSYMDWNTSSLSLRRKDGTQWTYQRVGTTSFYRPVKILDTNGNFISIVYSTASGAANQAIATITDTIGRVVMFNYDSSPAPKLQNITVTPPGGAVKTVAYFNWGTVALNYSFTLAVTDSQASGSSVNVLTSCAYPNAAGTAPGMSYAFTYGDWGIVKQIPRKSANGTVRSYMRYDYPAATSALSDHPTYQHQFVSADGSTETSWTYAVTKSGGVTSSFAVTGPSGTTTTTNLFTSSWQTGLVSSATVASGGTPLRTIANTWTQDDITQSVPVNPRALSTSTNLNDSGQVSSFSFVYDGNGNVTDVTENDFSGTVRKTHTVYVTGSAYTNQHMLDRPLQVLLYDASSTLKSRTDLAYDGGTLTSVTSAPQHDNTNYGSGFTIRGNVTSTTRYTNAAAGTGVITRSLTYDSLGNLLTAQLDCCQSKQWNFSSATNFAYPDSVTRGGGATTLTTRQTYDVGTGLVLSATDENNQVFQYAYDALNRSTSVSGPLGTSATSSYDDNAAQPAVTKTTTVDAGKNVVQITTSDGLGGAVKQQTQDGAGQNATIVETQYDSSGRVSQVSNPHGTSEAAVWTQKQYDALSRAVKIIPPDGSGSSNNTQFSYSGNRTTVTDPSGKQRRSIADALRRLTEVDEPNPGAAATFATGSATVSGSEQSATSQPATSGSGSVTISGFETSTTVDPCVDVIPPRKPCPFTIWDSGTVSITVNGFTKSVSYGRISTPSTIASGLAAAFNGDASSPVTASASGSVVTLTAKATGAATNYSLSATASSGDPTDFGAGSFTAMPSGATLTGGRAAATTSDSGTVTITLNGTGYSTSFGAGDTAGSIASRLASAISAGADANASASGGTVNLTSKTPGTAGNYSLLASYTWNTTQFVSPSFTTSTSGSALAGGLDASALNNNALVTTYGYDPLDGLTLVTQGVQQRSFVYDSLGNLSSAATPEAGNVSYTYNSFNLVSTRTDARGVTTSYAYDGLNRLQQVSYNVGTTGVPATSAVTFAYGTSATQFNNGRLTSMTDGTGSEAYTYDALGRITALTKTIGTTAYPLSYSYDIAGSLKSITYPSGRVVAQSFDALERLTQVSSGGTNYVSGIGYNSAWEPTGLSYGNGVAASFGYNSRMQLASLAYAKGASTLFSLSYDYTTGVPGNNGQIQRITDNVDATRTTTYTYDALARLKTASNSQWSVTETYDRYGNRNAQSAPVNFSQAADPATNRLPAPYAYDAAGNMTNDGLNTLLYNAENRLVTNTQSGATSTYSFDGNNLRVKKISGSTTTVYIFSGAKVIAEYANGAALSSPAKEYIYAGAQLLATIAGATTNYHLADHLSPRVTTNSSGSIVGQQGHFPFGESWYSQSATTKWQFTSYERDSESGNDYALARYNINRLGRFSSPDPLPGSLADPQSLNRFAYGRNDPIGLIDPSGLTTCDANGNNCYDSVTVTAAGGGGGGGGGEVANDGGGGGRHFAPLQDDAGGGGGGNAPHVDQKVLTDCLQSIFTVQLADFQESKPGRKGYFTGFGPDLRTNHGNTGPIVVVNDAARYNAAQIAAIARNPRAIGFTDPLRPYENYGNNNNTLMGTLVNQVHELGHSLFSITQTLSPLVPEPQEMGSALENCVRQHHGFARY
ncbi:MAG TPA: RHS repeat-associated core domain-containing protein [Candidatus Acidoferrum sp.]|nr:RHS repeat-associated core domain-containing protein [Candidatus Acidoferrum sp.]